MNTVLPRVIITLCFVPITEQYILAAGGYTTRESAEFVSLDPSSPIPSCLQDLPAISGGGRDVAAGAASLLPGKDKLLMVHSIDLVKTV